MDSKDVRIELEKRKPNLLRLQMVAEGISVGKVLGDRVLVRLIKPWTVMDDLEKKGTLFIPETVREANSPLPSTGIVVKLGTECTRYVVDGEELKEGDAVLFSRYAGTDVRFSRDDNSDLGFRILETREILCTLVGAEVTEETQ